MPAKRRKEAEQDIFIDRIAQTIDSYKKDGKLFCCPAWDDIVIDERGRVLICCGSTGNDSEHVMGSVFDLSFRQMRQKKTASTVCLQCRLLGIAEWAHNNHHDFNQLSWPSGGGMRNWQLKFVYNRMKFKNDVRSMLIKFGAGRKILNTIKNIKNPIP